MDWHQRKVYYTHYFNRVWGKVWRFPFIAMVYPIAWFARRRGVSFLTSRVGQPRLGHLAWELQCYVKGMQLGIWGSERPIFLASSDMVANTCLRDYWAARVPTVKNRLLTTLLRPFNWAKPTRRNMYPTDVRIRTTDGRTLSGLPAVDHVFIEYDRRFGESPVLTLDPTHRKRGREILSLLGVPREAWFVALHVREPRFIYKAEERGPRDGDITDYLDAVHMITERGGWVIRLGNPNMARLPELPKVVDYAFSEHRSAEMDIFLLGECRFFLGSNSGPVDVSPLFGRPNAMVGLLPVGQGSQHRGDIYLPNTYWSTDQGRLVTFHEIMNSDMRDDITNADFDRSHVRLVRPEPSMIKHLAAELLDRVNGTAVYDDTDALLQERWAELLFARETIFTRGALSRVGRDFLRCHSELLDEPDLVAS
jgi:putative glycosyltransferase (TIGR04372 family)